MIPVIGSAGWALVPLRPTRYSPSKLAKVKVRDGFIVSAFALERTSGMRTKRLHWAEGVGSWQESA